MIDFTIETFGRIDILILNSSATTAPSMFEEMNDLSVVNRMMEVNLFGQVYITRYALPHLKKTHGQLVISNTVAGHIGL